MVVALIALMVALSGSAYAVGRASNDTIDACRNKWTGALSIKDACADWEVRVSWNVRGRVGAKGERGERGAKGATGATGPRGAAGADGTGGAQHVIDGNGQVVGNLVSASASTGGQTLLVQIGQRIWSVRSDGSIQGSGQVYFALSDETCSTPLLVTDRQSVSLTRPAGVPYMPAVLAFDDGTVLAWDVPRDQTTAVVTPPDGETEILRMHFPDGDCRPAVGTSRPWYGATALTPITPPTLVPPLTVG